MSTKLETLWAEIEEELSWRQAEIRFLQNCSSELSKREDIEKFHRSLVVMLYAHLEGFAKYALMHYVRSINDAQVSCKDVKYAIAAASLAEVFNALSNNQRVSKLFKKELPDDKKLHRNSRQIEFLERIDEFRSATVVLGDSVVDFESNLKPHILRKNLFQLGLDHEQFASLDGDLNRLLNLRNEIAHGSRMHSISESEYIQLRGMVFKMMREIMADIMSAIESRDFLRVV